MDSNVRDVVRRELPGRLKNRRRKLSIPQKQLADAAGVCVETICGYEKGKRIPPADVTAAMARELRVTCEWLMGLEDGQR